MQGAAFVFEHFLLPFMKEHVSKLDPAFKNAEHTLQDVRGPPVEDSLHTWYMPAQPAAMGNPKEQSGVCAGDVRDHAHGQAATARLPGSETPRGLCGLGFQARGGWRECRRTHGGGGSGTARWVLVACLSCRVSGALKVWGACCWAMLRGCVGVAWAESGVSRAQHERHLLEALLAGEAGTCYSQGDISTRSACVTCLKHCLREMQ